MCGVAGIADPSGADLRQVARMCEALVHRGPDSSGLHDGGTVALGVRRLAVVDVTGGEQPVFDESGDVVAVLNGELYNHAALRDQLRARGHRFVGRGDTECLVHLYEEYGAECVHRLRGMFAFALWDARRGTLLLARDRVGEKPLYYREHHGRLTFASEPKALTRLPETPRTLDLAALDDYLTYGYVPAPASAFAGVRKLPPGHLLTWRDGRTRLRRYWHLDDTPHAAPPDRPEADAQARELLLESTRLQAAADRPVGTFLSGGLDSSAVVAALARTTSGRLRTFAIGFEDPRYDEREPARVVARRYGTEHQEFVLDGATAAEVVPELAHILDEPLADSSTISTYCLARLAAGHVTIALTGDGGDEAFGGYERYAVMARMQHLNLPPGVARPTRLAGRLLANRAPPRSRARRLGQGLRLLGQPPRRRYPAMMECFSADARQELYTDAVAAELANRDSHALLADALDAARSPDAVGRLLSADVATYLPGDLLVKTDRATMAHSLEARSPFLDHHLLEWAARLPVALKVQRGATKRLLKEALRPWLPDEILHRPKRGFSIPLGHWLRTGLRDLAWDALTDQTARSRGLVRPEVVHRLLTEHQAGVEHSKRLWSLLQLELWHRHHLDAAPSAQGKRSHCTLPQHHATQPELAGD